MISLVYPASQPHQVVFREISSVDRACSILRRAMFRLGYNQAVTDETIGIARRDGDLTEAIDLGCIDPDDIDALTEAFASGFDQVGPEDPAWVADEVAGFWVTAADVLPQATPAPTKPAPAEAVLPRPVPAEESRAFARQDGRFDVRSRPTIDDWRDWQRFNAWRDEHYVYPDVLEAEAAEIGRPFSRCY